VFWFVRKLSDQYRTDSLVLAFEQAVDQKAARVGMGNLVDEERVILAVEALEREVNNGGYHQFFLNSPEFASIIVSSLGRIGCPKTAELTQDALDALRIPHLTREEIESVISKDDEDRDETLSGCDERYYKGSECIELQLFAFIKANKSMIRL
jgi:hypothetical protein